MLGLIISILVYTDALKRFTGVINGVNGQKLLEQKAPELHALGVTADDSLKKVIKGYKETLKKVVVTLPLVYKELLEERIRQTE